MTNLESKQLAEKIATKLFTPGDTEIGDQLRIMRYGRYIAGWGFKPAVDAILRILESTEEVKP